MKNNMELWKGIVVDIMDPLQKGRVRVRILGHHTPNTIQLENSCLPWATVLVPVSFGHNTGIGISPNGITINTLVVGYFDDPYGQQPTIIGILPRPHLKSDEEIFDGFSGQSSNVINGFLDPRNEEQLEDYPVEIKNIEYLPGEDVIIENLEPQKYPKEDYIDKVSTSIVVLNGDGIEETLIGTKRKTIENGGVLEEKVTLAVYPTKKYEVVPNSIFPIKRKAKFIEYDDDTKYSSDIKSDFSNYAAIQEKNRINSNNEEIYQEINP